MVEMQLLPTVGLMAARTVDAPVRPCKLPAMLVLMTGITTGVADLENCCFDTIDRAGLVAFIAKHVAVASGEWEFGAGMIKLHYIPALDIVAAGTALLSNPFVELSGVRILVASLTREIRPREPRRLLSVDLRAAVTAAAGNGLMRSAQRESRICMF